MITLDPYPHPVEVVLLLSLRPTLNCRSGSWDCIEVVLHLLTVTHILPHSCIPALLSSNLSQGNSDTLQYQSSTVDHSTSGSYGDFYDMIHLNSLHCNTPVQWRALVIPIVIRLMQAPHGWLNLGEGQDTHIYIYTRMVHDRLKTWTVSHKSKAHVDESKSWSSHRQKLANQLQTSSFMVILFFG